VDNMYSYANRLRDSDPPCAQCLMRCSYERDKTAATSCAMDCAGGLGSVAYSYYPYGCFWHTITGSVYYNSNPAGAGNRFAQPLCAGAASKALPSTDRHCAWASHAWTPRRCGGNGADVQPCSRYNSTVSRARSAAAARPWHG
jgi:hypothetical protein